MTATDYLAKARTGIDLLAQLVGTTPDSQTKSNPVPPANEVTQAQANAKVSAPAVWQQALADLFKFSAWFPQS